MHTPNASVQKTHRMARGARGAGGVMGSGREARDASVLFRAHRSATRAACRARAEERQARSSLALRNCRTRSVLKAVIYAAAHRIVCIEAIFAR